MGQNGTSKEAQTYLSPQALTKSTDKQIADSKQPLKEFSEEEVAQHKDINDAWIIIKGHVFDITHYHHSHPGGSKFLLAKAGIDATDDFEALRHSTRAQDRLKTLCIGKLIHKNG